MNSSLRKIALLILSVIILPVLVFSVFEIGNLRQNEKVNQDIYRNQLDAILYSVNQYSDDIISNLSGRIENSLNNNKPDTIPELNGLLKEYSAVVSLIQFNNNLKYLSSVPFSYRDSTIVP